MYIYIYICIYINLYMQELIYAYIYIYIYTHIYLATKARFKRVNDSYEQISQPPMTRLNVCLRTCGNVKRNE